MRCTMSKQDNEQAVIATEAGIEKGLSDEITKGLKYTAKSLHAFNERERLTLLVEAEIAYQNALSLILQGNVTPESPIAKNLHRLGTFLEIQDTLQQKN